MSRVKNVMTGLIFGAAIAGVAAWLVLPPKDAGREPSDSGPADILSDIGGRHPNPEDAPIDGRLQNRLGLGGGSEGGKLTQPSEDVVG